MIPVKLIIQGLYSYKEKQTIDFNPLTEAGLFGIFGAVGSGKSSILEAMMLALFAESERVSMRGERIGLLHLQASELYLDFYFKIGEKLENEYRAVYSLKRKKKDFNQLDSPEHLFYKKTDNSWLPLQIKDASEILGMKLTDFKRTIIIPQGKFREFVELKDADRSEMLKDLFQLDRFDLSSVVKSMIFETTSERNHWKTIIESLGDVSQEAQSEIQHRLEELALAAKNLKGNIEVLNGKSQALGLLEAKYNQYTQLKKEKQTLIDEKDEIDFLSEKLNTSKLIKSNFSLMIAEIDSKRKQHLSLENSILDSEGTIRDGGLIISQLEEKWHKLKEEDNQKLLRYERIGHLRKMIQVRELDASLKEVQLKLKDAQENVATKAKLKEESEVLHKRLEVELIEQKKRLVSREVWSNLQNSVQQQLDFTAESAKLKSESDVLQHELLELQDAIAAIHAKWFDSDHKSFEEWKSAFVLMIADVEHRKERIGAQIGLMQFVPLVKENEPCPLCGSLEHPRMAQGDHDRLEMLDRELVSAKKRQQSLLNDERAVLELSVPIGAKQSLLNATLQRLEQNDAKHLEAVSFMKSLGLETLESAQAFLADQHRLVKTIEVSELSMKTALTEQRQLLETIEQAKSAQADLFRTVSVLEAQLKSLHQEVYSSDDDWWRKYESSDIQEILGDIDKVELRIVRAEEELSGVTQELEGKRRMLAIAEGALERDVKSIQDVAVVLSEHVRNFMLKAQELGLAENFIREVLNNDLDEQQAESRISLFQKKWNLIENTLEDLEKIDGVSSFDPVSLTLLKEEISKFNAELEEVQKEQGSFSNALKVMVENEKKKLEAQRHSERLEIREHGLRELEGLFKGKGFVSYISNFYLQDLCRSANIRFQELTRHQMAIEVDQDNNFYIKDFLNEGKLRLLKTLSGGQMFQASLCLALALSERVKSLHHSEKSFFFLDEGFGSLDRSSLAIVFETLKSLRKENRVVGLISHVDELQQEMDVCLKVRLDKEHGSIVTMG